MNINFNTFILIFIIIGFISYILKNIFIKTEQKTYFNSIKYPLFIKIIKHSANLFKETYPILLIIFIFRSFFYEPFKIPSASMMPTLLIGDFIIVEKFSYFLKNPITNKIILFISKPKYGDVVVFQYPKNTKTLFIKRIIGLPTDKIIYNEKTKEIKIYKLYKHKYILNKKIISYSKERNSNFIEEINFLKNNINEIFWNKNNIKYKKPNSIFLNLIEKKENINNINYNILLIPNILLKYIYKNSSTNKIKTWIIPKNMYFVMGDYRDNSEDSRYWGFVHQNNLIGKAKYIWMSLEKEENHWLHKIRFDRIGKKL